MTLKASALWMAGFGVGLGMMGPAPSGAGATNPQPHVLPPVTTLSEAFMADSLAGLALKGFDPVSYQIAGRPVAGEAAYEAMWNGISWRFALAANRAAFLADPERFAPKYAGLDPIGVAEGRIVDAEPTVFALVSGQLLLFLSEDRRERFLADPRLQQQAEASWPEVARQLTR